MSWIRVRPATPADAAGIHAIYQADSDGSPWSVAEVCAQAVRRRLAAGYLTLVAEGPGGVVGHADYVVGEEAGPRGKTIHLSVLQVHPQFRGHGAGRALIQHGLRLGQQQGCRWLTTQPSDDARGFYAGCGLRCVEEQVDAELRCCPMPRGPWERIAAIPRHIATHLPLRIGRAQSSIDMWHLCESDFGAGFAMHHTRARTAVGRAFLVLRSILDAAPDGQLATPMLIAWSNPSVPLQELLRVASAMAQEGSAGSFRCILPQSDLPSVPVDFGPVVRGRPDFWGIALG